MNTPTPLVDEMFSAGVHYGYSKTRRHPSTSPYIFGTKNKVDIIDLEKTSAQLEKTLEFIKSLAKENKTILFVGVKAEARQATHDAALALDMPFVIERWIGGALTNFSEIKRRIQKLVDLRDQKEKGELDKYTKKERLLIDREIERLNKYFGGLVSLKKAPDAMIIIDAKREHIAKVEAQQSGVPVVALMNTDTNIRGVEHPVIGNDAAVSSIKFYLNKIVEAYNAGKMSAETAK